MYFDHVRAVVSSLLITFLTVPALAAAPRCVDLFTFKPRVSVVRAPNIFKVESGSGAFVYKIYTGPESRFAIEEQQGLLMLADVLSQAPQGHIKVTPYPRVTAKNEWLLKDEVWGYLMSSMGGYGRGPLKQPNMLMLVTRFEQGRETIDLFNDPHLTISQKQQVLDSYWKDMDQLISWIQAHPELKFNGRSITVKEVARGDWYEFISKDGMFEYEYRSIEITNGQVSVMMDAISNSVLKDNGDFVLFDPY